MGVVPKQKQAATRSIIQKHPGESIHQKLNDFQECFIRASEHKGQADSDPHGPSAEAPPPGRAGQATWQGCDHGGGGTRSPVASTRRGRWACVLQPLHGTFLYFPSQKSLILNTKSPETCLMIENITHHTETQKPPPEAVGEKVTTGQSHTGTQVSRGAGS